MAVIERPPDDPELVEQLEHKWRDAPGIPGFFTTVDHKRIGLRYIYTSFVFFFIAGLAALTMRDQLASSNNNILAPETYNMLFTLHGTTMIFLFNTPVLAGFGNYLIPLQIGSRDMAFPRLNAFSYWVFLFAGLLLYSSVFIGHPPDGGWFAYVPLTGKAFSPGINIDFWGLSIIFVGVSTTVGAVNFIVTIFKFRAPGMTFNRMPIFVWSMLVFSFMVIFSVPAVTIAAALLELDRLFGTAFYTTTAGGSALLYQHLFWFWGHPEVYILFVPATGMVSMMVSVFSRRALAGYVWIATSLVAVGFISFGVWVHHMFATGLPPLALAFFSAVSLLITIPSGVQFFAWIATMWKGKVELTVPMLFVVGFLLIFLLGGITGVMVSILPFDWAVTDSYFIVAHLHYVLNGAVVFPIFGAIYYWMPKMTGRMLDERLGKISFWVMFIGFNLTFFPMHILGVLGMPRRVWTYSNGLGWDTLNEIVSIGSVVFGLGTGITLLNWALSMRRGKRAPANPWAADGLEWSISSPPPEYNFSEIPVVSSRHPLWEGGAPPALPALDGTADATEPSVRSLALEGAFEKTSTITSGRDTRPSDVLEIPEQTVVPLAVAFGLFVFFIGLLIDAVVVGVIGVALAVVAVVRWLWTTEMDRRVSDSAARASAGKVAVASPGAAPVPDLVEPTTKPVHPTAWWGMTTLIATESMVFVVLFGAYFFLRASSPHWLPAGVSAPELKLSVPFSFVLWGSSIPIFYAEAAIRRGSQRGLRIGLLVSGIMGLAFLAFTVKDFNDLTFGWRDNAYGSIFYLIVGLHALHVLIGLFMNAVVEIKAWQGKFTATHHTSVEVFGLYWHFVDAVWIFVFLALFLSEAWR